MNNLAEKCQLTSAINEHGIVVAREGKDYTVRTGEGLVAAIRAVGCLVEPAIDDLVLVSLGLDGRAYILCVLEREAESMTILSFERDVRIRSEEGRISISAKQELDLVGERELGMVAPRVSVAADQGDLRIDRASFFGSFLDVRTKAVSIVADKLESFCRRLTSLARHSYRQVDETDQLKCGRLHYEADSLLQMKGEYAKLHAEEDVHIGGERINIG